MQAQLHLAAQYLATAGVSFLDKKDDDSHTNLGFSLGEKSLQTWSLDSVGTKLCLDYPNFELKWIRGEKTDSLSLDKKGHKEVVDWIKKVSQSLHPDKSYEYQLHYELPYAMSPNDRFELLDSDEVIRLVQLRSLAQNVLSRVLEEENLNSDIRIWPHHFDTGAFSKLENSDVSVGLGLSIPDSLVNDHYFYISGYKGHESTGTSGFVPLCVGDWLTEDFKGAILPASGTDETIAVQFFREALKSYKS